MPYKDPKKQKVAQHESYLRTKEARREKQKSRRKDLRDFVISLKEGRCCADCGNSYHFSAMHWDHLPGYEKIAGIRELAARYQSKQMIIDEIAKCELVCANCHAVRTYTRLQDKQLLI